MDQTEKARLQKLDIYREAIRTRRVVLQFLKQEAVDQERKIQQYEEKLKELDNEHTERTSEDSSGPRVAGSAGHQEPNGAGPDGG